MQIFLAICATFITLFALLPLLKKDAWWIRVFDYPRVQLLVLALCCMGGVGYFFQPIDAILDFLLLGVLSLVILYLLYCIYPYTPLAPKQVVALKGEVDPANCCSIVVYNVYMYNQNWAAFLNIIAEVQPDLLLLMETDKKWQQGLQPLEKDYPYHIHHPLDNTYGMLLYSKLELKAANIHFLIEREVPSIHTQVILPSGTAFQLYGIHPKPPVPGESNKSTKRDAELLVIGKMAKNNPLPAVVAGDLNDVAWSYTSTLFLKMSQLLDPRKGRGFFHTFHARIPFLRFPLDHVFHDPDFQLVNMKRLANCGSDHFPIFIQLCYKPSKSYQQEPMSASKEDKKLADKKIAKVL